ncbi:MAG: hypothetical protein PHO66_01940 [Eubacteriales bacterium]|nr:hypothetical protein [Eubacteriales bacterium]
MFAIIDILSTMAFMPRQNIPQAFFACGTVGMMVFDMIKPVALRRSHPKNNASARLLCASMMPHMVIIRFLSNYGKRQNRPPGRPPFWLPAAGKMRRAERFAQ